MNTLMRLLDKALRRMIAAGACLLTMFTAVNAQNLNTAVVTQLAADESQTPCAVLLSGDPVSVLGTAGLSEICSRPTNMGGVPPSSVGGGFAATPPSAPAAVDARLEKEDPMDPASSPQRGLFFTVGHDAVKRIPSPFEDGYASDVLRVAAGFDVIAGGRWLLGAAVDGATQDGDFTDGGDFENTTIGLTFYGAYLLGDNGAVDFYAGYADHTNERTRRATFTETIDTGDVFTRVGAPTADFNAGQILAGIKFSYDWVWDNVTLGPRMAYDWSEIGYDTYNEVDDSGLALTFFDNEETSSQFSAGLAGSAAISTRFGVVLFEQNILYRHETDQDQRSIDASFVEDSRSQRFSYQTEVPDRDFLEFNVSTTFIVQNGWQFMLEYRGIAAHRFLDTNGIALGLRKEF